VSETIVPPAVDADLPSLTDLYNHYVLNTPATLRV
jgi:L-amino acid N-acyltransferase YncA